MKKRNFCITLAACLGIFLSFFAFVGCNKPTENEQEEQDPTAYSQGLEYVLNDAKDAYVVQGIGSCISTKITIPATYNRLPVTEIAEEAFCGLDYIQAVYLPDSIEIIGARAFKDCSALEHVEYLQSSQAKSVKTQEKSSVRPMINKPMDDEEDEITRAKRIYEEAFMNCIRMEKIVLPDGVEEIARGAFGDCGMMVLYTMAKNLNESHMEIIWNWIYDNPVVLNCLLNNIATDGYRYVTVDKIQYAIKDDVAMVKKIPNYLLQVNIPEEIDVYGTKFPVTSIHQDVANFQSENPKDDFIQWNILTIPKTITAIPDGAFSQCTKLTEVRLPNTMQTIGSDAFYECACLTKINFPDSLTSIGVNAFKYSPIQKAVLPKNITKYEDVFGNALKELVLPDGLTDFYGLDLNLTRIELPHTIQTIQEYSLAEYNNLQEIVIREGNNTSPYRTIDGCLYKIDGATLTLLCYPKAKTSETFVFPTSLTENGQTTYFTKLFLRQSTISDNPYLKKIILRGGTGTTVELDSCSLRNISKLEEVELDAETVLIGDDVFYTYATTLIATENVQNLTVGKNNRLCCENTEEDFATLSLGENCAIVWNCTQNHVATDGYIYAKVDGISYKLKDGTATLTRQASSLKKAVIPTQIAYDGVSYAVTEIENIPFNNTTVLFFEHESQPSHWTNLTNKRNPNLIFWDYKNNRVANDGNTYVERDGLLFELKNGNAILTKQLSSSPSVIIPSSVSLDGVTYPVNSMAEKVFYINKTLISVSIPESIQSIPKNAFHGCTALQTVTMSSGLVRIGENAFGWCESLENLTLPSTLKEIGSFAFSGCVSLKDVVLPNALERLGDSAFQNCYALEEITIPNGVKGIAVYTFTGCISLTEISLPQTLEYVEEYAFENTGIYNDFTNWENGILYIDGYLIKGADVPEKVQVKSGTKGIAVGAFRTCFTLKEIILPDGLVFIGSYAFSSCIHLEKIQFPASLRFVEENAFYNCRSLPESAIPNPLEK